jgi:hypothetical protein
MNINSYDEVPYPSLSYVHTYPDRLATLATLLGLTPAPVERCRVLEIGCASGGNLIPMAYGLPHSRFVGIDVAHGKFQSVVNRLTRLGCLNQYKYRTTLGSSSMPVCCSSTLCSVGTLSILSTLRFAVEIAVIDLNPFPF